MNPAYPQNAYPGFRPGTQPPPPPGMPMMDPNLAQMAQQRYMQQQQQQLAAMHAAGIMQNGGGFSGGPGGPGGPQGGMRMPPGMPMQMQGMNMNMGMGMGMSPGQSGPSSLQPQMLPGYSPQQPPKQKKKPGPQPRNLANSPASQMIPQNRAPPTSAEQYMKNAMHAPPPPGNEVEPWADALDEIDPRELAMSRFRARHEMLEEVFGPEPIKSIPLSEGDAWSGLGMDGETLEAKVAALEKENEELESGWQERLQSWTQHMHAIGKGESTPIEA